MNWTVSPAVGAGFFRAWLVDTVSGASLRITPSGTQVNAVTGQTSYTTPWNVTQPAGTYRVLANYYSAAGALLTSGSSSGTVTLL